MARIVTAAGPNAALVTADVAEKQVLIAMEDEPETMWHHMLLQRLDGARWITCDPHLEVVVEDLAGERVVPLVRNGPYPAVGRPFLGLPILDEVTLARVRNQAATLAEVHGAPPPPPAPGSAAAIWVFADPGRSTFAGEVPPQILSDPTRMVMRSSVGLALHDPLDGQAPSWQAMERILRTELVSWRTEKRSGAGRDPRLSGVSPATSLQDVPLLRTVLTQCAAPKDPSRLVFQGPSSTQEVLTAVVRSGLEPAGFITQFLQTTGASPKASISVELGHLIHAVWLAVCVDRLDPYECAVLEHMSRRILQIQKAIRRCPRAPDFEGLSEYMRHSADLSGEIAAPAFDAYVAAKQKDQATILKQNRMQREEEEEDAQNKRRQPQGEGRGDKKGVQPG